MEFNPNKIDMRRVATLKEFMCDPRTRRRYTTLEEWMGVAMDKITTLEQKVGKLENAVRRMEQEK